MANEVLIKTGTAIILADTTDHAPGATAANNLGTRTTQLDLTSLASGAYRQCTKFSFSTPWAKEWEVTGAFEWSVAPTAGGIVAAWIGYSGSATGGQDNPANLSGSDAAYNGYGAAATDADEVINQLYYIGGKPVGNDATIQVIHFGIIRPLRENGIVVIQNDTSQSFIADAVEMSVRLAEVIDEIQ